MEQYEIYDHEEATVRKLAELTQWVVVAKATAGNSEKGRLWAILLTQLQVSTAFARTYLMPAKPVDMGKAGKAAFDAYSESKGGLTYDGKPIPKWEEVGAEVQLGWKKAASAVLEIPNG